MEEMPSYGLVIQAPVVGAGMEEGVVAQRQGLSTARGVMVVAGAAALATPQVR